MLRLKQLEGDNNDTAETSNRDTSSNSAKSLGERLYRDAEIQRQKSAVMQNIIAHNAEYDTDGKPLFKVQIYFIFDSLSFLNHFCGSHV